MDIGGGVDVLAETGKAAALMTGIGGGVDVPEEIPILIELL